MSLPNPKATTDKIDFHKHREYVEEDTLADFETVIWSWINHLSSPEIAEFVLRDNHNVNNKVRRKVQAENISLYIKQAHSLYEAAKSTKFNTAPLLYYYSFLNLGKALCEVKYPNFHKNNASRKHGLSWKPTNSSLGNEIRISTRGVWHCIYEVLTDTNSSLPNGIPLNMKKLFSYCGEITSEYESAIGRNDVLIEVVDPFFMTDGEKCWITFSIYKEQLRIIKLSRRKFLSMVSSQDRFKEVKSYSDILYTFELKNAKDLKGENQRDMYKLFCKELKELNLYTNIGLGNIEYHIPSQYNLRFKIPQILAQYSILYWLSSLVRYDPHEIESIQKSKYWYLIDGFMNQSRIWLLELFSWELYNTEKLLTSARIS